MQLKHMWQLLVCASTDRQRQAAHVQVVKYGQWLRLLQVEQVMHGMNGNRNPAHNFIVKLSPCMCSYLAALQGNGWHMWDLAVWAFEVAHYKNIWVTSAIFW